MWKLLKKRKSYFEGKATKVFGIWTQDPWTHADFWLSAKLFYVVDYDGDGKTPFLLDENEITIFKINSKL